MKINIDGQLYQYSVKPLTSGMLGLYAVLRTSGVQLKDGRKVTFSKESIIRTAFKAIMTPFFIPFLRDLYKDKALELPEPQKHVDMIDYFIVNLIRWVELVEDTLYVKATTSDQTCNDCVKTISSLSASWYEAGYIPGANTSNTQNGAEEAGGLPHVHSGQDGNGQNTPENGDNQEKDISPPIP